MQQFLHNMPIKPRFTLKLSSCPENITKVEPFLQQIRTRYNLSEELYFNMLLVLTEAINNSILHGNGADPCKSVKIKLRPSKATLSFTISDEGCGFNPDKLPDPTSPPCLMKPNGRGVFLMRKLSDHVQYSQNGTQVQIKFKIHS